MKPAESALLVCVVGLAGFIGGQVVGVRRGMARHTSAGAIADRAERGAVVVVRSDTVEDFGTAEPEMRVTIAPVDVRPSMSAAERKRRIASGAEGTYIGDLVASRDSATVRWPDRLTHPLRVWIAEDQAVTGWNPDFAPAVRAAFDAWVRSGIPVHFTYVVDSAAADVHVRFVERFPSGISGKTIWSRDHSWWLVSSDIQLAVAHPAGGTVSPPQMRAIALHEVGHLLGLDHSSAPDNIMSARIRVRDITAADLATVRLLYTVPAGALR